MKEQPFDADALLQRMKRLSHRARLAFLLSCAERLVPNYGGTDPPVAESGREQHRSAERAGV